MPSSAHRKPPTAHHQPTSAGLAALASFAATGEGILAVACPYFLESMPPGSPVQYHIACVTRQRILYGRPSRSPWPSHNARLNHCKPCYILNTFKVFKLSSVKKTSRLPMPSFAAATPNNAEPLPDWASTGTLSSRWVPVGLPCERFSSTRLLSFMLTTRRSPLSRLIVSPAGIFKGLP